MGVWVWGDVVGGGTSGPGGGCATHQGHGGSCSCSTAVEDGTPTLAPGGGEGMVAGGAEWGGYVGPGGGGGRRDVVSGGGGASHQGHDGRCRCSTAAGHSSSTHAPGGGESLAAGGGQGGRVGWVCGSGVCAWWAVGPGTRGEGVPPTKDSVGGAPAAQLLYTVPPHTPGVVAGGGGRGSRVGPVCGSRGRRRWWWAVGRRVLGRGDGVGGLPLGGHTWWASSQPGRRRQFPHTSPGGQGRVWWQGAWVVGGLVVGAVAAMAAVAMVLGGGKKGPPTSSYQLLTAPAALPRYEDGGGLCGWMGGWVVMGA